MKGQRIEQIEKCIFYFMSGFALSSCVSIAIGNVFLSLSLVAFAVRLYYRYDDIWQQLNVDSILTKLLLFLMAAVILSAIFSGNIIAGLSLFGDYYGYRMLGFYIVLIALHRRRELVILGLLVLISFTVNNCSILLAVMGGESRPGGLVSGTMTAAGILSMGIPVVFFFFLYYLERKDCQYLILYMFISFCVSILALIYNETRGAWIAAVITCILVSVMTMRSRWKTIGLLVIIFSSIVGMCVSSPHYLYQRVVSIGDVSTVQSNTERLRIWTSTLHMFEDHPLLGVGFSQYERAYHEKYILPTAQEPYLGHAHSNVMQYLGESGALGCVSIVALWIYLLYYGYKGWMRTRYPAFAILFLIVLGMVLQGLTEYNMGNSVLVKLYWFALAICLQLIRLSKEDIES